jgi:putative heme-binding domain-containing protein
VKRFIQPLIALLTGFGLLAIVGVAASAAFFPLTVRRIDVALGKRVFSSRCAACHSLGDESALGFGPSLESIGKTGSERIPNVSAAHYILDSIVQPEKFRTPGAAGEMPADVARGLSRDELLSLTAFLCLQGAMPDYREIISLPLASGGPGTSRPQRVVLEKAERGKHLYLHKLKCVTCHPLSGAPSDALLAPDLTSAGRHTRDYLRESVLEPSKTIAPQYQTGVVVDFDGVPSQGRILAKSESEIRLLASDSDGRPKLHSFRCDGLESIDDQGGVVQMSGVSAMPSFHEQLSASELDDLVEFLSTLK